ncbi:glycoside hydrolase, family 32 [Tanacetum coccineum]
MGVTIRFIWVFPLLICLLPMLNNFDGRDGGVMASHKLHFNDDTENLVEVKQVYRTGYHFQSKKNWINAPMYYKGFYHLFYQYNPKGAVWGNIVWAHSVSTDLINWIPLEHAIVPSKQFDKYGCWSGSATILPGSKNDYRGIAYLYRSRDFIKWTKAKHPFHTKRDVGMWECPDFFPVSSKGTNGLDTSAIGDDVKYVFKASLDMTRFDYYTIGTYNLVKDKYIPDNTSVDGWASLRYDYGNFYASKTFFDPIKKRRILTGWANESSTASEDIAKGWSGIHLIPRKVWLDPSGNKLLQWPVVELDKLRGQKIELSNTKLNKGDTIEIKGITVAQADVDVSFTFSSLEKAELYDEKWDKFPPENLAKSICGIRGAIVQGGLGPFGLMTLASSKLEEYTPVFFRIFKTTHNKHRVLLCSDATPSSLNQNEYKPSFGGFVDVDLAEKKLSLRSLIDHSVVESFAEGGKTVISSRIYPTLAVGENAHLHVFNNGSEIITIARLNAWSMNTAHIN